MNKTILFALIGLIFASCEDKGSNIESTIEKSDTPEALEISYNDVVMGSINKRYNSGIIDRLFKEAMDNQPDLESIIRRLDDMKEMKHDSLESFHEYIKNNNVYWSTVNHQLDMMNDTILGERVREIFNGLNVSYKNKIANHEAAYQKILERNRILHDYKILIKLVATEPMMHNYQRNELTQIKKMNDMIERLDSLVEDVKPFTDIQK